MPNPFKSDDDTATDGDPKAKPEATLEEEPNALFADTDPDGADDDGDDPDEDQLFDKPVDDLDKPKTVPIARLGKVVGQRNELRLTVATLEKALESSTALAKVFSEKYSRFDNPAQAVAFDADFMDGIETLSKTDGNVAELATKIKTFIETGRVPNMEQNAPTIPTPAESKPDPRVDKIIANQTRTSVEATLAGMDVKPAFRKLIADYVVKDGAQDLTRNSIVKLAKGFIEENGFTSAEILGVPGSGKPKVKKPPTGGTAKANTVEPAGADDDPAADPKRPEAAKNLNEWEAQKEARRAAFVREQTT